MYQTLPYDEIKIDKNVTLEDILSTPDDSDIGYFFQVVFIYSNNVTEKLENFPPCPGNKTISENGFNEDMIINRPKTCIPHKKNFLIGLMKRKI